MEEVVEAEVLSAPRRIYWHDTGKMYSVLNRFLHERLAPIPNIIILFCTFNTWLVLVEFPQMIIPYLIIEQQYAKYTIHRTSIFHKWNNLQIEKNTVLNLGRIWFMVYVSCSLYDYWFAYPKILYVLFHLLVYLHIP